MKRARILLADDHRILAEGLKRLLEPEFELVGISRGRSGSPCSGREIAA